MTAQHTKTPSFGKLQWAVKHFDSRGNGTPYISDGDSARVLFFWNLSGAYNGFERLQEARDDAAYIVKCVNSHDKLVAVLELALACSTNQGWEQMARIALAAAKQGE